MSTTEFNGPPPPKRGGGRKSPFTFGEWEPGETQRYPLKRYTAIRNAIGYLNKAAKQEGSGKHWRYAKVLEDGRTYVRVWRVS